MRLTRNRWTAPCGCAFSYEFDGDLDGDVPHSAHTIDATCPRHAPIVTRPEATYHTVLEEVKRVETVRGQLLTIPELRREVLNDEGVVMGYTFKRGISFTPVVDDDGHLTVVLLGVTPTEQQQARAALPLAVDTKPKDPPTKPRDLDAVGLPRPDLTRVTLG